MKKIITIIAAIGAFSLGSAQVIISEATNPTPTNSSVLLEFGTADKGIILPSMEEAVNAVDGTFFFNTENLSVEMKEDGSWTNLTLNKEGGEMHAFSNSGADVGNGAIIGADETTKPGVLVLESTTQAMVLPKVEDPAENILSPIAGTMVYDTSVDMLAVYDGKNWSYWK